MLSLKSSDVIVAILSVRLPAVCLTPPGEGHGIQGRELFDKDVVKTILEKMKNMQSKRI